MALLIGAPLIVLLWFEMLNYCEARMRPDWSSNPVGKYNIHITGGDLMKIDTQTGRVFVFVPARSNRNQTGRSYWYELVTE